ncbi:MAG: arylesterase [Bdellovibrionales bacterium]|nr:arylesterase [Bdellovibrionales bacterium]
MPTQILAFGDSLTAGYRLAPAESYPAQLEAKLKQSGYDVAITNAGVSGDTSAQALARVEWSLKQRHYDFVLLAIGANDGLRLAPVKAFEKNLRELVQRFQRAHVAVVLVGMRLPINFDAQYRQQFEGIYPRLAREAKLPFVPFLLENVAAHEDLNLEDQMHPNAKGYAVVVRNVMPVLVPLLNKKDAHL